MVDVICRRRVIIIVQEIKLEIIIVVIAHVRGAIIIRGVDLGPTKETTKIFTIKIMPQHQQHR